MAFDSGMLRAVIGEIRAALGLADGSGETGLSGPRVDRVYQPQNDEIDLHLRGRDGGRCLLMRCGSRDTRIQLTSASRDNPQSPPTFCMLLRKHLQGAVLTDVSQQGFERVAVLEFGCRDELGFDCRKYLYAEVMGRNSNLILADGEGKIIAVMRPVDFSTSRLRQVLPGMRYEAPPAQEGKSDPNAASADDVAAALAAAGAAPASKALTSAFFGIGPAVAREAVYRASGDTDAPAADIDPRKLFCELRGLLEASRGAAEPCLVTDGPGMTEFSFVRLTQYGEDRLRMCGSFAELLDLYYGERDRAAITAGRAGDLQRTVSSAIARLQRKLEIQRRELADCDRESEYRADADLIIANIGQIGRGARSARLTDYSVQLDDGSFAERTVELDPRLTPSANAQKLYRRYAKCRKARAELTKQIAKAEEELAYLQTVRGSIARAETGADVAGIRDELERAGYARQKRGAAPAKSVRNSPAVYVTSGGFTVLCGRNNLQNDELTFRMAERGDVWFHAKGVPGSHVLLRAGGGEVPDSDLTEAAEIAAANSDAAGGEKVPVDYTDAGNVRKPSGSRPGFVIYRTNRTAYVTPDPARIAAMKRRREKTQ
jgi:predicted ribosome quality control (RQC) complex YloA/Tae2 family protein